MLSKNTARDVFLILLLAALALVREAHINMNPDNAWLLYAAERLMNGEKIYVDFLETNPPLIVWLNTIPVWLAGVFHTTSIAIFPWVVTALNLGVLAILYRRLADKKLFFLLALLLFALPAWVYGQREHLWVALILPYLVESTSERKRSILVAALAAVGFALKPFFLLVWAANELYLALIEANARRLFSRTNWIIGLVQLAYFLAVRHFTPDYFTNILPYLWESYFAYEASAARIAQFTFGIGGFVLAALLLMRPSRHGWQFFVILLASLAVMWVQKKDWLNHLYPPAVFGCWCLFALAERLIHDWRYEKQEPGLTRFTGLCLALAGLAMVVFVAGNLTWRSITEPRIAESRLAKEIDHYAKDDYVYPLSFNLQAAFPVIAYADAKFAGSFHHLWPLPAAVIKPGHEQLRDFVTARIVDDFKKHSPALVWVDKNKDLDKASALRNFDIITYLAKDREFAKLWKQYRFVADVEDEISALKAEDKDSVITYALYRRVR